MPVEAQPWSAPVPRRGKAPKLLSRHFAAGLRGMPTHGSKVVLVEVDRKPPLFRQPGQELEHPALMSGHARDTDRRRRIPDQRIGFERVERGNLKAGSCGHRRRAYAVRRALPMGRPWARGRPGLVDPFTVLSSITSERALPT
jgi:hypothetical protein